MKDLIEAVNTLKNLSINNKSLADDLLNIINRKNEQEVAIKEVNALRRRLVKLIETEASSTEAFNAAVLLTKYFPINDCCPITREPIKKITGRVEGSLCYMPNGTIYDSAAIKEWCSVNEKATDPVTRSPFTELEKDYIQKTSNKNFNDLRALGFERYCTHLLLTAGSETFNALVEADVNKGAIQGAITGAALGGFLLEPAIGAQAVLIMTGLFLLCAGSAVSFPVSVPLLVTLVCAPIAYDLLSACAASIFVLLASRGESAPSFTSVFLMINIAPLAFVGATAGFFAGGLLATGSKLLKMPGAAFRFFAPPAAQELDRGPQLAAQPGR